MFPAHCFLFNSTDARIPESTDGVLELLGSSSDVSSFNFFAAGVLEEHLAESGLLISMDNNFLIHELINFFKTFLSFFLSKSSVFARPLVFGQKGHLAVETSVEFITIHRIATYQ